MANAPAAPAPAEPHPPPPTLPAAAALTHPSPLQQDDIEVDAAIRLRPGTELRSLPCSPSHSAASLRISQISTELDDDESAQLRQYALQRQQQQHLGLRTKRQRRRERVLRPSRPGWWEPVERFWRSQVSVEVGAQWRRDHLALERTYLGYLRTSLALSIIGVVTAQLFRLQHAPHPDRTLGYFVLGVPLAAVFIGAAVGVSVLGAIRFWRQQHAMARGRVLAGGWEIGVLMVGSALLLLTLFVMVMAVNIKKEV